MHVDMKNQAKRISRLEHIIKNQIAIISNLVNAIINID